MRPEWDDAPIIVPVPDGYRLGGHGDPIAVFVTGLWLELGGDGRVTWGMGEEPAADVEQVTP